MVGTPNIGDAAPAAPAGRWVCLDFVNTVEWRTRKDPVDTLADYAGLLSWAERQAAVSQIVASKLRTEAEGRPQEASEALARAIALREAIYHIAVGLTEGTRRDARDVKLLNAEYAAAISHRGLADNESGFEWDWVGEMTSLNAPTWHIAESAARLITSGEIGRLKACPGEGCGWLFIDTSRNRSRRWCEMEICGNRAKVRRHRSKA